MESIEEKNGDAIEKVVEVSSEIANPVKKVYDASNKDHEKEGKPVALEDSAEASEEVGLVDINNREILRPFKNRLF